MRVAVGRPRRASAESSFAGVINTKARSFAFAARFLDPERRRATQVLYAFFRTVDDLVDEREPGSDVAEAAAALDAWDGWLAMADRPGASPSDDPDPLRAALAETMVAYAIPPNYLRALLLGLRDDLTGRPIATFADLERYSFRVAATVGLAMCHVLGATTPRALSAAAALGIAMQLTNILRDVADDLHRGRLYLPADELERFGCSEGALARGAVDECLRELLRFQIERARRYYAAGAIGLSELTPEARYPIALASTLYASILDKIEIQGYDVFSRRAMVGRREKVVLAGRVAFGMQLQRIGGAVPWDRQAEQVDTTSALGTAALIELAACGAPGFEMPRTSG